RRPLSDPAFVPFLGLAAELAIPVVVHCGRWTEIAGFGIALDVAASAPDVRFILGHLGGDSPRLVDCCTARVAAEDPPNVFLGTESIREPWLLELALERIGPARLVFGSDYNLNHPEPFRRLVEILDLADADRELILAGNIDGLFPPRHRFGRTAVAPHGVEP
ncbi:MAG: amidohydrolase family protein, partial [Deltaproteobacteria bacterium]|nr:amidohydrolase family protein [Deltaproteobacteria bacterium]